MRTIILLLIQSSFPAQHGTRVSDLDKCFIALQQHSVSASRRVTQEEHDTYLTQINSSVVHTVQQMDTAPTVLQLSGIVFLK